MLKITSTWTIEADDHFTYEMKIEWCNVNSLFEQRNAKRAELDVLRKWRSNAIPLSGTYTQLVDRWNTKWAEVLKLDTTYRKAGQSLKNAANEGGLVDISLSATIAIA